MNDIGALAPAVDAGPDHGNDLADNNQLTAADNNNNNKPTEYAWQMRSRFRRSISSSDIEKYQRHLNDPFVEDGSELTFNNSFNVGEDGDFLTCCVAEKRKADDEKVANSSLATVESADGASELFHSAEAAMTIAEDEAAAIAAAEAFADNIDNVQQQHPLGRPPPCPRISGTDMDSSQNHDTMPKKPRRSRRHRRSSSDVPELHMENAINSEDVAPRKPSRTSSRAISPPAAAAAKLPPPIRPMVRFAENRTTSVEIPKVTEEMKPKLFYTKRDVKRFRMNEHRRQEEQIRAYMEYLNKKHNALDNSTSIYD